MNKNLIYKPLFTIRTDDNDFLTKYDMFIKFLIQNKLNYYTKNDIHYLNDKKPYNEIIFYVNLY